MNLTFNWTTAAMMSVPVLLCWLAFVLWTKEAPVTPHEDIWEEGEREWTFRKVPIQISVWDDVWDDDYDDMKGG
jgi:hypothetical protein